MNQLSGKYANVVLSVEEGRSMDFIKNEIYISACLNNRVLESDRVKPGEKAIFNTELIWETEKRELRKIRIANQPIRVECISIDGYNRKERIGFALLSLRSAPIISFKDGTIPLLPHWQKLIGCQADKKKYHPELFVCLSIRDHLLNDTENIPQNMPLINEEETTSSILETNFPLKYLDDGHIQIGEDDTELQPFTFNLFIKEVRNLDALLPEVLVFQENKEKYYLSFTIFGISIKTQPICKDLHKTIPLNEKVVVRILSTTETFSEFLKTANIIIHFYYGPDKLGTTEFCLDDVSFKEERKKGFFKFPSPNGIVPFENSENSPIIDITTWVSTEQITVSEENLSRDKILHNKPSGDNEIGAFSLGKLKKVVGKSYSETIFAEKNQTSPKSVSVESVVKNLELPLIIQTYNINDTYKKFSLCIIFNSIVFKKQIDENGIIFKFLHPKCGSYVAILKTLSESFGKENVINTIKIKVNYISMEEENIYNMIKAWPPRLILTNECEKNISTECIIEPNAQQIEIKTFRTLEPLARVNFYVKLEAHILSHEDDNMYETLQPPLIDEFLTLENLIELEKWKENNRVVFESKVTEEKTIELDKQKNEWDNEKRALEQKLENNVQKCRLLQEQLQEKLENLKIEKNLAEQRTNSTLFEDIFKENWHKYSKSDQKDIIVALSKIQRDNENLRNIVKDQSKKIKAAEKTALTKEQTSKLLHDVKDLEKQFEDAQKAKEYFKEQWKKACEEIHELKLEENKQIQNYISSKKEELRRASTESLHNADSWRAASTEDILSHRSNLSYNENKE